MAYNTTAIEASSDFTDFIIATMNFKDFNGNDTGFVGYILLFMIFIGLFVLMKRQNEFTVAITGSSFILVILSSIFAALGFIAWIGVLIPILLFIGSILYFMWTKE
jgi:hypothetical protein